MWWRSSRRCDSRTLFRRNRLRMEPRRYTFDRNTTWRPKWRSSRGCIVVWSSSRGRCDMRYGFVLMVVLLGGLCQAPAEAQTQKGAGALFKDCPQCPDMVIIPTGSFVMGEDGHTRETPRHTVTIRYPFAVSRFDVTFDEWDACAADGGCGFYRP